MKVLHLSGDYPDPVRRATTKAIQQTIDHLSGCEQVVISTDRRANPFSLYWKDCGKIGNAHVFAYGHWGLPLGIGLFLSFFITARRVYGEMEKTGFKPDVIHAHRFSFDGIGAWLLSRWWGVPFVASVRGEVESKVFRFLPHYRPLMRRMAHDAAAIYYVSLWFRTPFRQHTGVTKDKERILPNIVSNTRETIRPTPPTRGLVSIFNFEIHRKKGLPNLLKALKIALTEIPSLHLELIGHAPDDALIAIRKLVAEHDLSDVVNIRGSVAHDDLVAQLSTYRAMVLPSFNETFGMVYTEALFAGTPVLYSQDTGIDGYLNDLDVGVGVDPNDIEAIAKALAALWQENAQYRNAIAIHSSEIFKRFDPIRHMTAYQRDLEALSKAGN